MATLHIVGSQGNIGSRLVERAPLLLKVSTDIRKITSPSRVHLLTEANAYHVIDLANKHNIDLRYTQSCIESPSHHCGECWFCLERTWGYDQLKK